MYLTLIFSFFFFNDTATTEIYTLSLHDALPIFHPGVALHVLCCDRAVAVLHRQIAVDPFRRDTSETDRKSTRLNSSHLVISYAVFCLKKKKIDKYIS